MKKKRYYCVIKSKYINEKSKMYDTLQECIENTKGAVMAAVAMDEDAKVDVMSIKTQKHNR